MTGAETLAEPAPRFRRATAQDALALAGLIDLSNAGADRPDFERAVANVLVPGSDVGFDNAVILEMFGTAVAAMIVNPLPAGPVDLAAVETLHLPFEMLKAQAGGQLYLRNIAVLPQHRGKGYGSALASLALDMASLGCLPGLCAVVHRHNQAMRTLMTARGLAVVASGFLPSHPDFPSGVDIDLWSISLGVSDGIPA